MTEVRPVTDPDVSAEADTMDDRYGSAIADIRKQREEIQGKGHLDLLVPGYKGKLMVKYRDLTDKQHDELAKRFERAQQREDAEGEREAIADILIAHCDRIYVLDPATEQFIELEENGDPLKFERRLAALLGLPGERSREVVVDVFSPMKDGDSRRRCHPDAIAPHMEAIFAWRQGREEEINRRLLGESNASE